MIWWNAQSIAAFPSDLPNHSSSETRGSSPFSWMGKSMMVVVPPTAAARVPVKKSSEMKVLPAGVSMWVWGSMPPGITSFPEASTTRSAGKSPRFPNLEIFPSSIRMSSTASRVAVMTRPPLTSVVLTNSPCSISF